MTQSTNLKLDLLSATDLFDTDKIKSNFEKIDNTVLIPTKIIDNCVTDNSLLPLSAKQGKLLQDQITKLNGDLTFYKHPLNMTVKMSGKLESIAEWLKNNTTYFGVYNYIRVQEPIDSDGYFGNSSFDIVWNFSSLNYGWITLRSDNPKSIIFGRLVAGKAEWDIPVFKSI